MFLFRFGITTRVVVLKRAIYWLLIAGSDFTVPLRQGATVRATYDDTMYSDAGHFDHGFHVRYVTGNRKTLQVTFHGQGG